jgi:hypothetical protein
LPNDGGTLVALVRVPAHVAVSTVTVADGSSDSGGVG